MLESVNTDGNWTVVDTGTLLAIPQVTKIKYFHQISETMLVIITNMAHCLHVYDCNFSGLSFADIIGNCKAEGFVDGVDPLFSGISQVIHDHRDNNTLIKNSTLKYWRIRQDTVSSKIYVLLKSSKQDISYSDIGYLEVILQPKSQSLHMNFISRIKQSSGLDNGVSW